MKILEIYEIPPEYMQSCLGAAEFFIRRNSRGYLLYHRTRHMAFTPKKFQQTQENGI